MRPGGCSGLPDRQDLNVPVTQVGSVTVPNPVEAIDNIVQITAASLRYHAEECHSHPYSSLWLTWPIMEHPVLFYATSQPKTGRSQQITDMGNPADMVARYPRAAVLRLAATRGPNWWRLLVAFIGLGSLVRDDHPVPGGGALSTTPTTSTRLTRLRNSPRCSTCNRRRSTRLRGPLRASWFAVAYVGHDRLRRAGHRIGGDLAGSCPRSSCSATSRPG